MTFGLVTALLVGLFVLTASLIAYGMAAFRRGEVGIDSHGVTVHERRVDMRREVLWTSLAATLLLILFALVR